jgi:endoglucanase
LFDLKNHLKSLVEAHAPSGHEAPVREIVRAAWKDVVDRFEMDKLSSLIGIKQGSGKTRRKIMLAAHIDEIGMMVRDIVDGFIYVHRISGVDNRVMLAQPVMVHGKRALPGVVAAVPPHLLTEDMRKRYPTFDELVIDLGLPTAEVNKLVQIGDLITVDVPMVELMGKRLAAKAMDDRACVAAVSACLNHLRMMNHVWDVYAVATVQEETGLRGAATAARFIQPDIAIALDVTFAPQPGVNGDVTNEMGGGPGIGVGPNFHPKLYDKIKEVAQANEIKLQNDIIPAASGTDAWAIQVALEGVPTALLEIPLRSMHSPVETIDLRDVERCGRLLALFIASLDADFLAAIEYKVESEKSKVESA